MEYAMFVLKNARYQLQRGCEWSLKNSHWSAFRHKMLTRLLYSKSLTLDNMNPCIKEMGYVVRSPLIIRAEEIENELKEGKRKPFKRVIRADITGYQTTRHFPITFIRQVLALVAYPKLLQDPKFPDDVKQRARNFLDGCRGCSIGAYHDATGIDIIRKHCAQYIENRDGIPADWQNILVGDGASSVIMIGYYLDEAANWSVSRGELERAITEAKQFCNPRAIVIINPGNPTGQVLTRKNIEEIIKFAYKEKIFILADEVYQHNIYYPENIFFSFRKVLMEMGPPYNQMELASFMSCSKGYMGEGGLRGGYCEILNLEPEVQKMFIKSLTSVFCPNSIGQAALDCVVNPLKKEDPSFDLFEKEKNFILNCLKEGAEMVYDVFNSCDGISCSVLQGAIYAFPQIKLPPKAIEMAKSLNQCPSVFYCFQLLEQTGICFLPGADIGQVEGTYHFRITILLPPEELQNILYRFRRFHEKFITEYK